MTVGHHIKMAVGPTILLQSGAYFDLLDPAESPFTIEDIAHGLSNTCRFAGQCASFYSVAEHCVLASHVAAPEFALQTLMHDAAEAFIGDVTRPLKSLLPEYKAIERSVETAIMQRFGIADWNVPEVKEIDLAMLATEQLAMMPKHGLDWAGVTAAPVEIAFWRPHTAREAFLERFAELSGWINPNGPHFAVSDDGVMTALPAWPRNDHATMLRLLMASVTVHETIIATWTDEQCREADVWSCSVHLSASDNDDIQVPPKPAFLPDYDDVRGIGSEFVAGALKPANNEAGR
jgi:hypothetical protein